MVTFPAIEVLPPALVFRELAATVELKVVVPVELTLTAPKVPLAPAPNEDSKLTCPEPVFMVSVLSAADTPPPVNVNAEPLVELRVYV